MDNSKLQEILDDFRKDIYIHIVLDKHKVLPIDFFNAIEDNLKMKELYNQIENANNKYLEEKVKYKAFTDDTFPVKDMMEFIKAQNKKKFSKNTEDEKIDYAALSENDLNEKIMKLLNK